MRNFISNRYKNGMALVIVLWATAFLSTIALSFSKSMNQDTRLVRNRIDAVQAKYLAEAGINKAIMGLLRRNSDQYWIPDGTVRTLTINQSKVQIAILDESAKIDLNAGTEAQLSGLFEIVETDNHTRRKLVDAILDWRDSDNIARANGAEDDNYSRAGYLYGAKDAPFTTVDELLLVQGMTLDIFREIESAVTVYSGKSNINHEFASPKVLAAISVVGNSVTNNRLILGERFNKSRKNGKHIISPTLRGVQVVTIIARAIMPSSARSGMTATVKLTKQAGRLFTVLDKHVLDKECDIVSELFECFEYENNRN